MSHSHDISPYSEFSLYHSDISTNFSIHLPPSNNPEHTSTRNRKQSGYSSTSPPGTTSTCSSSNSLCYGTPPDEFTIDDLIHGLLLQVVKSETSDSNFDLNKPSNDAFDFSRCSPDCNDQLYDTCHGTRQNNSGSSKLIEHFGSLQRGSFKITSPPTMLQTANESSVSPTPSTQQLHCDIHRESQQLWCQTCNRTYCSECCTDLHRSHVTVRLIEAIEGAGAQANQVLNEARLGINSLREDVDAVQMAAETLEERAQQAKSDVMLCVRRVTAALETRRNELLGTIEKTRAMKFASLQARNEGLRNGIVKYTKAVEKLSEAMESPITPKNPLDILVKKDMVSSEVFQIRQNLQSLPKAEENWISFSGPESTVMGAINNLGSIKSTNPGSIGDRRAVRGRGSSPQNSSNKSQSTNHGAVTRGRPIPGNNFPVILRTGRNTMHSIPKTLKIIGTSGDSMDNLCRPWGVACDKDGNIIVADRSNNRIQIYREDGTLVRQFGSHGNATGQFDRPAGVAVDGRKRIIVADKDNHRIQILTMEGMFLQAFGEKGCRSGQFNYPWDVAVNSECQIVVSDTRNHRVQLFSAEGIFLRKYGYESTPGMWKHFDSPRGVAFNPEGNVVTTDFNNHRVVIIDSDFLGVKVLGGDTNGSVKHFLRPQGIIIDDEGNVIVADSRNHRIQVFDSMGTLQWSFGTYGKGTFEMDRPSGIALTPSGKIAVIDFGNNRLLII